MPAATFDMKAFETFFFRCAADPKFSKEYHPAGNRAPGRRTGSPRPLPGLPVAIAIMRDRVLALAGRFDWVFKQRDWGRGGSIPSTRPGHLQLPHGPPGPQGVRRPADFPSIWRQRQRKEPKEMQLHWDGNNTTVEERNKSAAFGTGTTPPTIDLGRIKRVEAWIMDAEPPPFSQFFSVDLSLAERARPLPGLLRRLPRRLGPGFHGRTRRPGGAADQDRHRPPAPRFLHLHLAVNQATLYAGYPWRFTHFQKTHGYANMPWTAVAAGALPAQRLGAQPARPARTRRQAAKGLLPRQRRLTR